MFSLPQEEKQINRIQTASAAAMILPDPFTEFIRFLQFGGASVRFARVVDAAAEERIGKLRFFKAVYPSPLIIFLLAGPAF